MIWGMLKDFWEANPPKAPEPKNRQATWKDFHSQVLKNQVAIMEVLQMAHPGFGWDLRTNIADSEWILEGFSVKKAEDA
jgi:hypothetical protein